MKKVIFLLFVGIFLSCQSPEEKIENLNGYWQIKKADLPEGITKEFPFSQLVDYFQVKGDEGFRKKVQPQFGGRFFSTENRENFVVKLENDSINLYYSTPYDEWKETILSSDEDELIILNERGIIYTYERFTPFKNYDGEEK